MVFKKILFSEYVDEKRFPIVNPNRAMLEILQNRAQNFSATGDEESFVVQRIGPDEQVDLVDSLLYIEMLGQKDAADALKRLKMYLQGL